MIARVVVDSPLPHLDRPFDYMLPPALDRVEVGTRVRVPFAGRLSSAVVIEVADAEPNRALKAVKSAAGLPSYSPEGIRLAREIAERYGGSLWDVLRLMAPPRVAALEKKAWPEPAAASFARLPAKGLDAIESAASAAGLADASRRLVWAARPTSPSTAPADALLGAAVAMARAGGSALVVCPDARNVAAIVAAATDAGLRRWTLAGGGDFVVLDADDGPTARYSAYLAAMRGLVALVIGTRQVAWLPVPTLAGIVVWDEASSTLEEPRAPYPHARTVSAMRVQGTAAGLVLAGYAVSAEAVALVEHGFARRVETTSPRDAGPSIDVIGDERREREGASGRHWLPAAAWKPLVEAARLAPAAVLVPQAGYAAGLACNDCGALAECTECGGDLARASAQTGVACTDCGTAAPAWHCPTCAGYQLRPVGLGVERIAAQLARMVPDLPLTVSSAGTGIVADGVVTEGLVVATPAALPGVAGGYGHLVIVGARVNLSEGLGAETAALRRWFNAAALVRSRREGGGVSVVGELEAEARRCLAAWDGWDSGARDLAQRVALALPPHRRALRLDGPADAVTAVVSRIGDAEVTLSRDSAGAWLLASRADMQGCVAAARDVAVTRSKEGSVPLYVKVDARPGT